MTHEVLLVYCHSTQHVCAFISSSAFPAGQPQINATPQMLMAELIRVSSSTLTRLPRQHVAPRRCPTSTPGERKPRSFALRGATSAPDGLITAREAEPAASPPPRINANIWRRRVTQYLVPGTPSLCGGLQEHAVKL